jgi:hypothetical protein
MNRRCYCRCGTLGAMTETHGHPMSESLGKRMLRCFQEDTPEALRYVITSLGNESTPEQLEQAIAILA